MIKKIKRIINLISNMGMRYLFFRVFYLLKTKLGWHKKQFPINPEFKSYTSLEKWKNELPPFFFYGKEITGLEKEPLGELLNNFKEIRKGRITFFSSTKYDLGLDYDWITNPSTNYKYNINQHWSLIEDFSKEVGDIKFVWEKSRFSFLYDIIRYDFHFQDDQSEFVFSQIESFIDKNPINMGPNYKCSQEISLRILNWTFALYYYKDSDYLTNTLFQKIMHAIYWQLHHVYHNINFSRIAVRNNHAITETLMLYLSDKLFPFFPNVKEWSRKGKIWFEQEIEYQIYPDGTFLQFSMNYHRVVIQLLTWGIQLAKLNNDAFKDIVYERAKKSLEFLDASKDPISGKLPNYGPNDGALFFKLTNDDYRVYSSQLNDLRAVLYGSTYTKSESNYWYGKDNVKIIKEKSREVSEFKEGGYYIVQDGYIKTFFRCGMYKDRPCQSDNLHIDIWVKGKNIFRDSGTYKYNTEKDYLDYFTGCEGHNTVGIDKNDQMLRGGRFIWYYWIKRASGSIVKKDNSYSIKGKIGAFKHLGKNITHTREVEKSINEATWKVQDTVLNKADKKLYQYWHINPDYFQNIEIESTDRNGNKIEPIIEEKWFSGYYGSKEKSIRMVFITNYDKFNTIIKINENITDTPILS